MSNAVSKKNGIEGVNYTPASAVASGDIIVQSSLVGIAKTDIAIAEVGTLAIAGVFDIPQKAEVIAAGKPVYWDADGNPYDGVAGTGAMTATVADGVFAGFATGLTTATTKTVRVAIQSAPVDAIA